MTLQTPPAFSPEDLRKNFDQLQSELSVVQNELDQALGVWRAILDSEKQEFQKCLDDHQRDWERDETQWQKDREAYEQKIQDLETFFTAQVGATEKNAIRALDELDAAWQQERLRWQQVVAQQTKEARQREELQNASYLQLEQQLKHLTEETSQLGSTRTENALLNDREQHLQAQVTSLETQLAGWQKEKAVWQQTLSDRLNEIRLREEDELNERQQKDILIQTLQQRLVALEGRLQDSEQVRQTQQDHLETYISNLETQIASLNDFVQQILPGRHPLRRKSDVPGDARNGVLTGSQRASN